MEPSAIIDLALGLGTLVTAITIGLTGAFKKAFPSAEPLAFSLPCGAVVTALSWFATRPIPDGVAGWAAFVLVLVIGALLPSGLFDAGVNFARKVARV